MLTQFYISIIMFLSIYIKKYRKIFVWVLILATINQIFSLLDPQIFRLILDNYVTKLDTFLVDDAWRRLFLQWVGVLMLASLGIPMVSRVAKNFQDYFANNLSQLIGMDLYQRTIKHAFSLPFAYFEDNSSWQILDKISRARQDIQKFLTLAINTAFLSIISLIFIVIYVFNVSRQLGSALLLIFPIMWYFTFRLAKKIRWIQQNINTQSARLAWSTTETIRNMSLIKILWLQQQEYDRLEWTNQEVLELELTKIKKLRILEFVQWTMINFIRVGLTAGMIYLIYTRAISVGQFFSIFVYSFILFGWLAQAGEVVKSYQEAQWAHDLLEEIMNYESESSSAHYPIIDHVDHISAQHISFWYTDTLVLQDVSFEFEQGKTYAFVGPSWSGKSSIIKLLCWLYPISDGKLVINNTPIWHINKSAYQHRLGIVTQEPQLFSGSIYKNLEFISPDMTQMQADFVIKQAALQEFIAQLPDGIHTQIGEWWLKLSWGQKQRLAIARALLRKPDLLIFDEATSALDSITESEISQTIKDVATINPHMITVLVAHRLSTIMHADQIYVLERGRIVEQGTHDMLIWVSWWLYAAMRRQQIWE